MITQNQIDDINEKLPSGFLLKIAVHIDGHQIPVLHLDNPEDCRQGEGLMAAIAEELDPRGSKPEPEEWAGEDRHSTIEVEITADNKTVCIYTSDHYGEADVDVSPNDAREITTRLVEFADWIEGKNGTEEIQT